MSNNTWWTSDHHHAHKRIVEFTGRPWSQERNTEELIARWNSRVGVMDDVYHLGDFAFIYPKKVTELFEIIKQLNGNIHFIKGNHCDDKVWRMVEDQNFAHVAWVKDYHELTIGTQHIVMSHYPMAQWNRAHHGTFMLHGHTHGSYQGAGKILDCGIDNHPDFQVWSYEEICKYMEDRQYAGVSHHKEGGR